MNWDKEDFVIEAVNRLGTDLKFASDRLKDNKEIVSLAVKNCGWALEYASERLKEAYAGLCPASESFSSLMTILYLWL